MQSCLDVLWQGLEGGASVVDKVDYPSCSLPCQHDGELLQRGGRCLVLGFVLTQMLPQCHTQFVNSFRVLSQLKQMFDTPAS